VLERDLVVVKTQQVIGHVMKVKNNSRAVRYVPLITHGYKTDRVLQIVVVPQKVHAVSVQQHVRMNTLGGIVNKRVRVIGRKKRIATMLLVLVQQLVGVVMVKVFV